jgi:hypothetical protein
MMKYSIFIIVSLLPTQLPDYLDDLIVPKPFPIFYTVVKIMRPAGIWIYDNRIPGFIHSIRKWKHGGA